MFNSSRWCGNVSSLGTSDFTVWQQAGRQAGRAELQLCPCFALRLMQDMRMVLAHCGSLLLDPAALQEVGGC